MNAILRKRLILALFVLLLPFGLMQPSSLTAAEAESANGWINIAVGATHNIGVKLDGTVWIWGEGNAELFGRSGSRVEQAVPLQVKGLKNIVQVAAGGSHSLALRGDGTVWSWGANSEGELGDGTKSVYEIGSGRIFKNENKSTPLHVKGLEDIVQVAADHARSYAVKEDGTLWAWGSLIANKPVQLQGYTDVESISTGYGGPVILKKDGTVWQDSSSLPSYWDEELQNAEPTLVQITGLTNVIAIAAGGGTTHALQNDGTVWGWGYNGDGEVGDGTTIDRHEPVRITGIKDVKAIASSAGGPFYLKKDGTVWSNGSNLGGQLGIGSYDNKLAPTRIEGLVKIKQIVSNGIGYRVMAIRQDNTLWSWGNGYVGDGTKWWRTSPVWVKGSPNETLIDLPLTVELNGTPIDFDQQPIVRNGRTLVPLRQIFEALGAKLEWNDETNTITATKGTITVKLTSGEAVGYVNGQATQLEAPAVTVNGRTMVPARFIGESFGADVGWNEITRTVIIEAEEMESDEDSSEKERF